jgi:acetyl-CoA carboxylase biotin carboxyl carrier protein
MTAFANWADRCGQHLAASDAKARQEYLIMAKKSVGKASPGRKATPATIGKTKKSASAKSAPGAIDTALVRDIARLLEETNVGEIEISKGDLKVRVSRYGSAMPAPAPVYAPAPAAAPMAAAQVQAAAAPAAAVPAADHPGAVTSPMVGTAYRKPSPDSKNFVEIGSSVKAGDKLMLIEAMKTFNDIVAPRAGKVTAIMIEDGQPVEFGQALFIVE